MKRNYKLLSIVTFVIAVAFSCKTSAQIDPDKDKERVRVLNYILTQGHFKPQLIDDKFSSEMYENFIEGLDPAKRFFLASDIREFDTYKDSLDDAIKNKDLTFYYKVLKRFNTRLKEAEALYPKALETPFDYTKNDVFSTDYEKNRYSEGKEELLKNWRKQLKAETISRYYDKIKSQDEAQEKGEVTEALSLKAIEEETREKTRERTKEFFERIGELDHRDWYGVFLNSMASGFDPHTVYMSPQIKTRFDQSMSGKLEGIGARLSKEGDYVEIASLVSGGPAWKGGELEVGDIILKVAQGDGEPLDIVGMRLSDSIEFIKGPKGSEVRLTVKKVDGTQKIISIIRDVVELEDTFVRSSVVEKDGKKLGIIYLPKFYVDFQDNNNYRTSASDMELEIERLKEEGVEGLLIDLRNNGGGSLRTVIDIAGLFIDKGPVVQVKYREQAPKIHKDRDNKVQWDGPLVVMVNEFSASASEIFAAAMQDYKRGVVVGSKKTFGKGTVQSILGLNNYSKYNADLGALKLTIQKFYRVNGGSTQLKGVEPDVIMPSKYKYLDIGEEDEDNALEWDKIKPAEYAEHNIYNNYYDVIRNSKKRIISNPKFRLIDDNAKYLKEGRDDKKIYLNYDAYKTDIEGYIERGKVFDSINDYTNDLTFKSPLYELPLIKQDSVLKDKRTAWHTDLNKDIYMDEALKILSELETNRKVSMLKN